MRKLFALGSNGSGQLGIGHNVDVSSPIHVNLAGEPDIKRITAGGNHTLILRTDGKLFSTGINGDGRCFREPQRPEVNEHLFKPVDLTPEMQDAYFVLCAATWEGSIGVLSSGMVIACGTGRRGELGLGREVQQATKFMPIPNFPPDDLAIVDIAASLNHVVTVLSNGDVYGWGSGKKGQLGLPPTDQWHPRKFDHVPFRVRRVTCGKEFTFLVGDPETDDSIVLGSNKWSIVSDKPHRLSGWVDIAASWGSLYVLLSSGGVLSWGRNDRKQLCPQDLDHVQKLAVGSEHALCIFRSGQVIVWGWGEHGNCGSPAHLVNQNSGGFIMQFDEKAIDVGAGCATSWITVDDSK